MQHFPINYLALLAATFARMVVGMLWYSPLLFRTQWMKLSGRTPEDERKGAMADVIAGLVGSVLMAFVLVHAVHYAGADTAPKGAAVGFFNWAGFLLPTIVAGGLHERKPFALVSINLGFQLAALLVMGAIVAVWT